MIIRHQLSTNSNYFPNWEVKFLILGTFNPEGGAPVNYYYARTKNQTWSLLSNIFGVNFNPSSPDFFILLKQHGIACVDMIEKVIVVDNYVTRVIGQGYSDSAIINNSVIRKYNTQEIQKIIENNPNLKVLSTWGKGSNLRDWKNEISKIPNIIPLVSPSLAARVPCGVNKLDYMLENWREKFNYQLPPQIKGGTLN
jgi:hypothetical protein